MKTMILNLWAMKPKTSDFVQSLSEAAMLYVVLELVVTMPLDMRAGSRLFSIICIFSGVVALRNPKVIGQLRKINRTTQSTIDRSGLTKLDCPGRGASIILVIVILLHLPFYFRALKTTRDDMSDIWKAMDRAYEEFCYEYRFEVWLRRLHARDEGVLAGC